MSPRGSRLGGRFWEGGVSEPDRKVADDYKERTGKIDEATRLVSAFVLAGIEWVFLRVLEHEDEALKHIHQRLANEPDLFVEVVSLVFRAHDEGPPSEPDPTHARYAEQAFALLMTWHGPIPGAADDGGVNSAALDAWVDTARASLQAAGRGVIGDQHIGHALWYAPTGEDGHLRTCARTKSPNAQAVDLQRSCSVGAAVFGTLAPSGA